MGLKTPVIVEFRPRGESLRKKYRVTFYDDGRPFAVELLGSTGLVMRTSWHVATGKTPRAGTLADKVLALGREKAGIPPAHIPQSVNYQKRP